MAKKKQELNEEIFGVIDESSPAPDDLIDLGPLTDNASEVVDLTKEQILEADMKNLVRLDSELQDNSECLADIQIEVDGFLKAEGLDKNLAILTEQKKALKKDYEALKEDIGGRGLELSKKTKYTNKLPVPGVQIKEYKKEELEVDRSIAIGWAVENEHETLLDIIPDSYLDVLKTGVLKGQPGKVKEFSEYKAFISLKPYQKTE